jgi:3-oxoadipate enol-lactonase
MAADAKAVLDAAGVESAHVIGTSMGGMIAQEFVLNYPESVRSLTLAVTMCGGKESVPADMNVLLTLQSLGTMSATEAFWAMAPFIYDVSTPRSVLEEDLNERLRHSLKPQNYAAQLQAIITWQGTFARLGRIRVPTLVIHGLNDQLIVPQNGRILASAIPNAKLVELENASHMFMADQPERAAATVLSFLECV